jgi:hypothetical protein
MLDAFEARAGVKLPPSYRDFVQLFGPGQLAGWFTIAAPLGAARQEAEHLKWADLEWWRDYWQGLATEHRPWVDPAKMRRLVFFSEEESGPWFAWDPQDQTPGQPGEYRVHLRERIEVDTEVVADSFEEFVTGFCFSETPVVDPEDPESRAHPHYFQPTELRTKAKEGGRDWPETNCQRARDRVPPPAEAPAIDPTWLRANDRAILRLAHRIHEQDSFNDTPILADALEDAGCTNEALLSHLRCDGWHLRNCWALKEIFDRE